MAAAEGLLAVEEFPHDAVMPTAPAMTSSLIRIGKILLWSFLVVGMRSLLAPLSSRLLTYANHT
jgi:hypothetical protein